MDGTGKKLSQLCTGFAFKQPSCSSEHIFKDSHLTSAFPKKVNILFLSIKISHSAKAHLKGCMHRAALLWDAAMQHPRHPDEDGVRGLGRQQLEPTAVPGCRDVPTTPKAWGQYACRR